MEVILKEDIKGLGYKNDTITVKGGYGRNFLIPKGKAMVASRPNRKMIEENIRQAAHKLEKLKKDAEGLAEKIGELVIDIPAKAGEQGKIFGTITALQIADTLKSKGFEIDRKHVNFKTPVKEIGEYDIELELHKEVKHDIKLNVIIEN